ncbi:MAG TPA: hypothetical protein VF021_08110 [Longimicrobiales bacterium]
MADQQVNTTNGGSGGMYALLIVIVILIIGAVLYFTGVVGTRSSKTDIDVKVEAPANPTNGGGGK